MAQQEPSFGTFWDGAQLGPIERACLTSFRRLNQRLTVFSYAPIADLPDGIEQGDAAQIMPSPDVIRYAKGGSVALHSNIFRYRMMAQTDLVWTDLDIILLRPLEIAGNHLFGFQSPTSVNGALLRLPPTSPALQRLLQFGPGHKGVPPHVRGAFRVECMIKHYLGGGLPIERWPWGSLGPNGLTHALRQSGEITHALPVTAFYSVPFEAYRRFADPGALDHSDLPKEAYAIHLWNKELSAYLATQGGLPHPDSFLARYLGDE